MVGIQATSKICREDCRVQSIRKARWKAILKKKKEVRKRRSFLTRGRMVEIPRSNVGICGWSARTSDSRIMSLPP